MTVSRVFTYPPNKPIWTRSGLQGSHIIDLCLAVDWQKYTACTAAVAVQKCSVALCCFQITVTPVASFLSSACGSVYNMFYNIMKILAGNWFFG